MRETFESFLDQLVDPRNRNVLGHVLGEKRASQVVTAARVARGVSKMIPRKPNKGGNREVVDLVTPEKKRKADDPPPDEPPSSFRKLDLALSKGIGMPGVYRGKFKRGYKVRRNPFLTLGYEEQYQGGGIETKTNGVEMGHSYPVDKLLLCWCAAIVRLAFSRAGLEIPDWLSSPPNVASLNVAIIVKGYDGPSTAYPLVAIPANATYLKIAEMIRDLIRGFQLDFIVWQIIIFNENATADYRSEVFLDDTIFVLKCSSQMVLQNRTSPVVGSSATDDVRANPLVFKKYWGKGNVAMPRSIETATGVYGDAVSGYMQGGLNDNVKGMNPSQLYSNCRRSYVGTLDPGAIKKDSHYFKFVGPSLKFMEAIKGYIVVNSGATTISRRCALGHYALFEFERLCDTRTAEPDISVGFEIIGLVGGYMKTRRKRVLGRNYVDIGSITPV